MTSGMPLEYQVCALGQSKELAELLGKHAPGSLWYWIEGIWTGISNKPTFRLCLGKPHNPETRYYPAYTGDELGALLKNSTEWSKCPVDTVQERASIAIEGLNDGWIKKEEFQYPDFEEDND